MEAMYSRLCSVLKTGCSKMNRNKIKKAAKN